MNTTGRIGFLVLLTYCASAFIVSTNADDTVSLLDTTASVDAEGNDATITPVVEEVIEADIVEPVARPQRRSLFNRMFSRFGKSKIDVVAEPVENNEEVVTHSIENNEEVVAEPTTPSEAALDNILQEESADTADTLFEPLAAVEEKINNLPEKPVVTEQETAIDISAMTAPDETTFSEENENYTSNEITPKSNTGVKAFWSRFWKKQPVEEAEAIGKTGSDAPDAPQRQKRMRPPQNRKKQKYMLPPR